MTHKERFIKALKREPVSGLVPHFEMVFCLSLEAVGKLHSYNRKFDQWNQMSETEKQYQANDLADMYLMVAEKYNHDAIFFHDDQLGSLDLTVRVLRAIREKSGDEYFTMMHGDPTFPIPDGDSMMDFTVKLYEESEQLKQEAAERVKQFAAKAETWANEYKGLLDGFILCSDYCFNTAPFYSEDLFDEFVGPYLKEIISVYHQLGFFVIKHTDGNIMPIIDRIIDCGPDALHSLDPQGGVDLAEVKRRYGDRVCLIGNVNCALLQTGTEEECVADVRRALKQGMEGYGYIFSTSNCVYTGMPLERYELMNRIWREEGIYQG